MQEEVEKMRVTRSFQPAWMLELYTNSLWVATVNETEISPEELSEFQRIMKRNAVHKLYKLENGLPLSMDEIEELTMLLVQADPDDSNHYPFWICQVCKVELDPSSPPAPGCWNWRTIEALQRLTLKTSIYTPFGSVKFAKLSWILIALGSTNSRSAGMNPKGQGVNQPLLPSQLHSTWMQGLPHKYPPQQTNETSTPKQGWRRG